MATETIIWTALPHGTTTNAAGQTVLHLSVFVAPRFGVDETESAMTVADLPLFGDWTNRVSSAARRFRVSIRRSEPGAASIAAGVVTAEAQELKPALWQALTASVPVVSPPGDPIAGQAQTTFATQPAFDEVRKRYQGAAIRTIYPDAPVTDNRETFADLAMLREAAARERGAPISWATSRGERYEILSEEDAGRNAIDRMRRRRLGDDPVVLSPFVRVDAPETTEDAPAIQVANVLAVHDRAVEASRRLTQSRRFARQSQANGIEELLTAIGGYPELLSWLGLTFELNVPLTSPGAAGWINVEADWRPLLGADQLSTWTAVDFMTGWPRSAADAPSKASGGFLLSSNAPVGRLDLTPIDLDGALLKLAAMRQDELNRDDALPALRSSGLELNRSGQGTIVHGGAERALGNDDRTRTRSGELACFAEDLNRGYRIDVKASSSGRWRSLHEVTRSFTFTGALDERSTTEGLLQIGASLLPGPNGDGDSLLIRESMARWNGWSLSAHRPSKQVGDDGLPAADADAFDLNGLLIRQRAREGSLPRLRFGDRYQFRIRTVDLAGNSRALADNPAEPAAIIPAQTISFLYRRFEPVDAPVLVPRQALQEGETLERIVLRSSRELDPAAFAQQHQQYLHAAERHIVPPKTTQDVAEQHGRFDVSIGASPEAKARVAETYAVGLRETGSINDPSGDTEGVQPRAGIGAGYTVHRGAAIALPYLPDPLARGVVFRNLPGMRDNIWAHAAIGNDLNPDQVDFLNGSVASIAFGSDATWPRFLPFRIRVAGAATFKAPAWDPTTRELVIFLPPGEEIEAGIRSFVTIADLNALGLWQWVEDGLVDSSVVAPGFPDDPLRRQRLAEAGDFWFLTPERRLTLVHAVQQPLAEPTITAISPHREAGQTFVGLTNRITLDARSTAKIDFEASWNETIDPVTQPEQRIPFSAHVREQEIAKPVNSGQYDSINPDRPARWNRKNVIALTTFGAVEGDDERGDPVRPSGAPAAADPAQPRPPVRHEFGDTRHRHVTYQAIATTRFRDYFPSEISDDASKITRKGNRVEVNVPSSARPAALSLLAAIPAFGWRKSGETTLDQSRQRAPGLRLYLRRPWYSSGDEERLGVVLWAPEHPAWPDRNEVRQAVSRWGRDPIWRSLSRDGGSFSALPDRARFPLRLPDPNGESRRYVVPGLEGSGTSFAVAAHQVTLNEDGTASCDIAIELDDVYTPFIRLALARFQPHSVGELHLSPVVMTDFLQLSPSRNVALTSIPDQPERVRVSVSGEVAGQALNPAGVELERNMVEVTLEQRIPGTTGDLGWEFAPFPAAVQITPPAALFDGVLWQGDIPLPSPRDPGQYRLAIREFEHLATDADSGFQQGRRLVFADAIVLP